MMEQSYNKVYGLEYGCNGFEGWGFNEQRKRVKEYIDILNKIYILRSVILFITEEM